MKVNKESTQLLTECRQETGTAVLNQEQAFLNALLQTHETSNESGTIEGTMVMLRDAGRVLLIITWWWLEDNAGGCEVGDKCGSHA